MSKKKFSYFIDKSFWTFVYMFPLFLFAIYFFKGSNVGTLYDFMNSIGFGVNTLADSPIYSILNSIFGAEGVLPLFTQLSVINFMTYYISVYLLKIACDFILFIPKLAHKWLLQLTGGEEI